MDSDLSFWLGLALAVPIGVGVNLATPAIGRLLGKSSERLRRRAERGRADEQLVVDWLADNRDAFLYFEGRYRSAELLRSLSAAMSCLLAVVLIFLYGEDLGPGLFMALFAVSFVVFELLANRHHGKIKEQVLLRMGWPNAIFVATEVAAKQLRSMSSTPVAGGPPSAAAAPNSRPHLAASTDDIRGRKPHD